MGCGGGTGGDEDAGQGVEHSVLREALKHGVLLHNDDEARIRPVQRKGFSSAELRREWSQRPTYLMSCIPASALPEMRWPDWPARLQSTVLPFSCHCTQPMIVPRSLAVTPRFSRRQLRSDATSFLVWVSQVLIAGHKGLSKRTLNGVVALGLVGERIDQPVINWTKSERHEQRSKRSSKTRDLLSLWVACFPWLSNSCTSSITRHTAARKVVSERTSQSCCVRRWVYCDSSFRGAS